MDRFSELALDELRYAGWHEGRSIGISDYCAGIVNAGYSVHEHGKEVLTEFGGLTLRSRPGWIPEFEDPLSFDPRTVAMGYENSISKVLGGIWMPIGSWVYYSDVFIESSGFVIATEFDLVWKLGESIEQAIEFSVTVSTKFDCIAVLKDGVEPWGPDLK